MLINLMFLQPVDPSGKSRGRLGLVRLGLLASRLAEYRDPESKFQKRVSECIWDNHPFHRSSSLWSILRCNFAKSSAIFNEQASSPKEWTFVLVGKLPEMEVLMPLLNKYLGSIPNDQSTAGQAPAPPVERRSELEMRNALTSVTVPFTSKSVREDVHIQMVDPKGSTVIYFPIRLSTVVQVGDQKSGEAELSSFFVVDFLVRIVETKLIELLRFKRGQVYGASVSVDWGNASPKLDVVREGTLRVSFECDPAEADELVEVTLAELQKLQDGTEGFEEKDVKAALEQSNRQFEEMIATNDFWLETVLSLYFSRNFANSGNVGATMAFWWRIRGEVATSITATSAIQAFRELLPVGTRSAIIIMRPQRGWLGSCKALLTKKSFVSLMGVCLVGVGALCLPFSGLVPK